MAFVYLLRCADRTFYVGHTDDLVMREKTHNDGHGATYTAQRRPVEMVYAEEHASLQRAVVRERQLKRWSAAKKEALVSTNRPKLKQLSQRRPQPEHTFTWRDLLENRRPSP